MIIASTFSSHVKLWGPFPIDVLLRGLKPRLKGYSDLKEAFTWYSFSRYLVCSLLTLHFHVSFTFKSWRKTGKGIQICTN